MTVPGRGGQGAGHVSPGGPGVGPGGRRTTNAAPRQALIWYAGQWRTPEGVESHRRSSREGHRRYDGSPADRMRRLARTIREKEAILGTQQAD